MHKIILDTDPGIDDAQAIAFALAHPDIELIGLTTVFGNASIATTTRNALIILDIFGRPDIQVAQGAKAPLIQTGFPPPDFVHGTDGLGNLNLPPPKTKPSALSAAEFIVDAVNESPNEITLIAIGPLTNLAQALALDPALPHKARQLIVMGGTLNETGNVSPVAEANFINDPDAADLVLAHDWPCTVVGLDVTMQTQLRESDLSLIRQHCGSAGQFLWDSSRFYIDFYASRLARDNENSSDRACAMHDASALVYLVASDAFRVSRGVARVVTEGVACGMLTLDQRGGPHLLDHWESRDKISVAIHVDAERVRSTFVDTLITTGILN